MSDLTQTPSQAHDDLKALVAKHERGEEFTELEFEQTKRLSMILRNDIAKAKIDNKIATLKEKAQLELQSLQEAAETGVVPGRKKHSERKKAGTPPELSEKPAPEPYEVFSEEEQLSTIKTASSTTEEAKA